MCIDYRRLNAKTEDDPYQMPRTDELVETIGMREFISILDLSKGYYQVPLTEKDRIRQLSHHHLGSLNSTECHLDSKVLHQPSKD